MVHLVRLELEADSTACALLSQHFPVRKRPLKAWRILRQLF